MTGRVRVRQGRAYHMDVALRKAALAEVREKGWDELTYVGVAARHHVTTRPLYDRYVHRSLIGADVASRYANPTLARALNRVLEAGLAVDLPEAEQIAVLTEALTPFVQPDADMFVALEFVGAAHVDRYLLEAMTGGDMAEVLRRCEPSDEISVVDATKAVCLLMRAFGLMMLHTRLGAANPDLEPDVADLVGALRNPGPVVDVPELPVRPVEDVIIDDPDPSEVALLRSTLLEVAEVGYTGATIARICARANLTRGLLFGRYATKLDLFLSATARTNEEAIRENVARNLEVVAAAGPGFGDAAQIRDWMRPEHALGRSLMIEQVRLSWRDPIMADVLRTSEAAVAEAITSLLPQRHQHRLEQHLHWLLTVGAGAPVAAVFLPRAWTLPFITIHSVLDRPDPN